MRRGLGALLAAAATIAAAGSAAAPAAAAPRCVDRPGLQAATSQAVVFKRRDRWYACAVRSRRVRSLGGYDRDVGGTRLVRLAGRYVGYHVRLCASGGCGAGAILVDVRTGRRRTFDDPAGAGEALGLQVTAAGSLAWARAVLTPASQRYEVVRAEPGGAATVVEEGPLDQFARGSLAAAGGRVYWFAQGRTGSATLR